MSLPQSPSSSLVHHRSKTILLLVYRIEDVAPVSAMCALLGDLYRHRTFFADQPMIVLRVAVVPALRQYFVCSTKASTTPKIVSWRAHEQSSSSYMARWITHVGAPDSIWDLEDEEQQSNSSSGLEAAFYGKSSMISGCNSDCCLRHDDGGMADMILVGRSSSLSLSVWKQLAQLSDSLSTHCHEQAPPLVIATLGNLRGAEWLSRKAFAEHNRTSPTMQQLSISRRRRPLALVGFPHVLWYCRTIDDSKRRNARMIQTKLSQQNSIVLMVGRDSASIARQEVCILYQNFGPATTHQEQILLLLRQTLFLPKTELDIVPSFPPLIPFTAIKNIALTAKPSLYAQVCYLLQDHHMIQFPCYMAIFGTPTIDQRRRPQQQIHTVGSLILSVLEEVLFILHNLHTCIRDNSVHTSKGKKDNEDELLEEALYDSVAHPLHPHLLAKLLGRGGALAEDLSHNRMPELIARMRLALRSSPTLISSNNGNEQDSILRQRWILEPLLTRAALSEWQCVTQQSPYVPMPTTPSLSISSTCPALLKQIQSDCIQFGLHFVLQLGSLLKLDKKRMSNIEWVVERAQLSPSDNAKKDGPSAPLHSWGIQTLEDLQGFVARYPPLGGVQDQPLPMLSKL